MGAAPPCLVLVRACRRRWDLRNYPPPPPLLSRCRLTHAYMHRFNANRAALVQSRIKALERMAEVQTVDEDSEYHFK